MKRRLAVVATLALACAAAFAQDTGETPGLPGFSSYKPIYGILGWGAQSGIDQNDPVVISFSMKYDPFSKWKLGLYLAYTQTMYWAVFADSSPFEKIDYNPELFFRFESGYNFLGDLVVPGLDFIQLGWEHRSNGQAGPTSRSWDRFYAQVQLGFGDWLHVFAGAKYFVYRGEIDLFGMLIGSSYVENPDIEDYTSNFAFQLGFSLAIPVLPLKVVLSFGPGGGHHAWDFAAGWQQLDVYFLTFAGGIRPYLQIWNGYGQSVSEYDVYDFNMHLGIAIEL